MNRRRYSSNDDTRIKISKTLSWLLRHSAEREGLTISNDGFIDVDSILSHESLKRLNCQLSDIYNIVENDSKKRYTLLKCSKTNQLKIKANQGHSIKDLELNLKKIQHHNEIQNAIHGTYLRYLNDIRKDGLKCMKRNHIHFTENENFNENLSGFRKNCEVLIYIDVAKAMNDGIEFFLSENNVILSSGVDNCIKPEYFLKIVERRTNKIIN